MFEILKPRVIKYFEKQSIQIEMIACGANFSFAVAKGGEKLYAWGKNDLGQCGISGVLQPPVPCLVSLPIGKSINTDPLSLKVKQIVAGEDHTMVLMQDCTTLLSFGSN